MTDQMRPPPLPSPFPVAAREAETEPGIGVNPEVMALRRENMRLRRERNAAKQDLTRALTESASGSMPPPTRKQKTVSNLLTGTKYAVLLPVVAFAGRAAARKWPEFQELVDAVLQGFGL